MLIIGLTGVSGSGKGYVCAIFERYGIPSVNSDRIVHEIYERSAECIGELRSAFGDGIVEDTGSVDRKALGRIVFSDRKLLDQLNGIVHKYVIEELNGIISDLEAKGNKAVIIDAPQLFEAGVDRMCDRVISVIAGRETRIARICKRDGVDRGAALARISKQHTDRYFRNRSDYIISNNGEDVEEQVRTILTSLKLI